MRLTLIQFVCAMLAGLALVFAFLAAGVAAASGLAAVLLMAAVAWVVWRVARRRLSQPRDRTA